MIPLIVLALGIGGGDLPASSIPSDLEERIVSIAAWPAELRIGHPFESAQLLLTATLDDGSRIDVTRAAELAGASQLVRFDEHRLLRPATEESGSEVLTFKLAEHELALPISVSFDEERAPSRFTRDVMPILTKAGCTSGTCHGSADGQNGFQLSLRGYDPLADHRALTDDLAGRRFNSVAPERSLFLQKPTGHVPHEGGAILDTDSNDYHVLLDWVARGATLENDPASVVSLELFPADPSLPRPELEQQFATIATYADGTRRDVSDLAILEVSGTDVAQVDERGLVRGLRRGETAITARFEGAYAATRLVIMETNGEAFVWNDEPEHNYIDALVNEKLERVRVLPSELCTDAEFLRRVRLDLTGQIPTAREVRTFLMDERDSRLKREELIDRLIGSPAFVDHWSNRWADLLQVNSKFLGGEGARRTRDWIRKAVASNMPYDEFVSAILSATGSTYDNPAGAYYKVLREPDQVMENTTQLFLGVRFNCNKCHDHPFEKWTRDQHWELAAYFGRVGRMNAPGSPIMPRSAENQIDGARPAFEEVISDLPEGEVEDPMTGEQLTPQFPYEHGLELPAELDRRQALARWLTASSNPYFARSYVNRLWSYLLGVGLIEPVDDLRAGNPPSNPALLDRLESEFLASDFDVRALLRTMCRSRAYQRSMKTNATNADDDLNYSHALARRLPAEVLYDALHRATGSRSRLPGQRPGTSASDLVDPSVKTADGFLDLFGRPPRESSCECERSSGMSLGQALSMINGPTVAEAVRDPENEIARLVEYETDTSVLLDELYIAFLGRPPTSQELESLRPTFEATDIENRTALPPSELEEVLAQQVAWEESIPAADWRVAQPTRFVSESGAALELQDDSSLLVTGELADKDHYSLVLQVGPGPIRGLRLEALTHESLPAKGPGRAENGNFVLNELSLQAVPLDAPEASGPVKLQHATADYSQGGYAVAGVIDDDAASGWAVSARFGVAHQAVFEFAEDVGGDAGTVLFIELDQQYGTAHTLGHLRISTTGSARPIRHHGLSDIIARALAVPRAERTAEQEAMIYAEFVRQHPQVAARVRLGAAQDLAWALSGSPAFLFNR